jgi:hopanoid biosynthesis associated protein HpnK
MMQEMNSRYLICTADDFGLALPVNEAVEEAHRHGILTSASLMVTAPAAEDAIERAKRLPSLGVGLHLVLVDGRPALPPEEIPDLVTTDGRLRLDLPALGTRIFFRPHVQRQVEREMRAQFKRFLATGLKLDHVDGHHHFHQHPSIVGMLARMAREYGIHSVRWPVEPPIYSCRAQQNRRGSRLAAWLFSPARLLGMRRRLARAGIRCNDHIFGLHESGSMTPARVKRFVSALPPGVTEIYCHPATRPWEAQDALPADYRCVEEFQAMADPALLALIEQLGIQRRTFGELHAR